VLGICTAACTAEPTSRPARDAAAQRAADSTIGASALPGAQGVNGAMKAADSSAARNAALDSLAKVP
jgi:hypothetical protein